MLLLVDIPRPVEMILEEKKNEKNEKKKILGKFATFAAVAASYACGLYPGVAPAC